MSKKILIDTSINNETRIALTNNENLEDYEVESTKDNRIKSNVYLAKISRVEASLQAAFVEYGGNRQGFLPFTEIHPDYFKIPVADQKKFKELFTNQDLAEDEDSADGEFKDNEINKEFNEKDINGNSINKNRKINSKIEGKKAINNFVRKYKIQEVIKPRQVLLIQVIKEERGLKGAALTTFLSFAGRYCVLMPNSTNSIGISRKIQDINERKKLKEVIDNIGIPEGMSVIIRTAGIGKIKKEIKKDLDFLINQWNKIRDLTLKSNAPELIYEEGNIIKRTIRDLYTKDISSILIDEKEAFKTAKQYVKELIPNQLAKLKLYKEGKESLFAKYNLEKQIDELYNTNVKLPSGGSIVINPTEALVAIDVNSGKATQHRNIENTALNTNLEAAREIAKQIKLRDLAGLIVIDFIDMDDYRNNFKVEKSLKTETTNDRARIQIGRISPFGLLELSRQRLRASLVERSFEKCNFCGGTGVTRNMGSVVQQLFRVLAQYCNTNPKKKINIKCNSKLANIILNDKKDEIIHLEKTYNSNLSFEFKDIYLLDKPEIEVDESFSSTKGSEKNRKKNETKKLIKTKRVSKIRKKGSVIVKKSISSVKKNENPEIISINENKNKEIKKGWWSNK